MSFSEEIEIERKKHLGLNEMNSKKVYQTIIECYKQKIIEAPRQVVGYTIDIVMCNMNYYNKLGKLEELNQNWGDNNFYVDLKNSAFMDLETQEDGSIESGFGEIMFKDISELNSIENISFSLKEMIEFCEKDNFNVKIYADGKEDYETTLEIRPYEKFKTNESIEKYLETLK